MHVVGQFSLKNPPSGFITALESVLNGNLLIAASISGELCVYNKINTEAEPVIHTFDEPIIAVVSFDESIYVFHPDSVDFCQDVSSKNLLFSSVENMVLPQTSAYQCVKVDENENIMIVALSNGTLFMYHLLDLKILHKFSLNETTTSNCKIQAIDVFSNYLVVATSKNVNYIFDLSCKKFILLATQESGFKFPITTDLRIMQTDTNHLPHTLTYTQSGIEGKVSVVATKIDSHTEPTVTINTAAKNAPISNSCVDNPSGIVVVNNPERFIFRAHRTALSDNSILIGPIYSLNCVKNYLITTGYGGGTSTKGTICLWDVTTKRRVTQCKGFPLSVVKTAVIPSPDSKTKMIVCGCSSDIFKNMPVPGSQQQVAQVHTAGSAITVVLLE